MILRKTYTFTSDQTKNSIEAKSTDPKTTLFVSLRIYVWCVDIFTYMDGSFLYGRCRQMYRSSHGSYIYICESCPAAPFAPFCLNKRCPQEALPPQVPQVLSHSRQVSPFQKVPRAGHRDVYLKTRGVYPQKRPRLEKQKRHL